MSDTHLQIAVSVSVSNASVGWGRNGTLYFNGVEQLDAAINEMLRQRNLAEAVVLAELETINGPVNL